MNPSERIKALFEQSIAVKTRCAEEIAPAIAAAGQIGARRTLLTHLSHEVDHHRHASGLPMGVEFAYDGQTLTLPLPDDREPPW